MVVVVVVVDVVVLVVVVLQTLLNDSHQGHRDGPMALARWPWPDGP